MDIQALMDRAMRISGLHVRSVGAMAARLAQRLLLLTVMAWLAACSTLPPRGEVHTSRALSATAVASTALARLVASSRSADEAQPAGFRLLPDGAVAFEARVALARRAEQTLDLQTYYLRGDVAGRSLMRELRDAAQRGVRVRLLVDDFFAAEVADLLTGLASFPNAKVRLFNPMPLRNGAPVLRLVLSPGDFQRYNRRMHNKLFVADNAVAIYGGRNIADEYFMKNREANFIDMDVMSTGQVVTDLSAAFDRYWNSELAWPVHTVLGRSVDAAAARLQFDRAVADAQVTPPTTPVDAFGQSTVETQLGEGRLLLTYATAQVHVDPPERASAATLAMAPTQAVDGLLTALTGGRNEVVMVSPYFVPGEVGMPLIRAARANGARLMVITNSLGSTDEPLVHDRYTTYRLEMLRLGVELFELSPTRPDACDASESSGARPRSCTPRWRSSTGAACWSDPPISTAALQWPTPSWRLSSTARRWRLPSPPGWKVTASPASTRCACRPTGRRSSGPISKRTARPAPPSPSPAAAGGCCGSCDRCHCWWRNGTFDARRPMELNTGGLASTGRRADAPFSPA